MKKRIFVAMALCLLTLSACKATEQSPESAEEASSQEEEREYPQLSPMKEGEDIGIITTNLGVIKVRFFPEQAPLAVENFTTHAKNGYYDGQIFHRVIDGFMIQGGDPTGTGTGGESIWGEPFSDELSPLVRNFRGALSMANSGENTNGSQFFIVQNNDLEHLGEGMTEVMRSYLDQQDEPALTLDDGTNIPLSEFYPSAVVNEYLASGGAPHLDFAHTVFGQVYEGMDIVDHIAAVNKTDGSDGQPTKPEQDVIIEHIEIQQYTK